MKFEIREHIANPDDPRLEELYDAINDLVNIAGHITIRELFTGPKNKYPAEIPRAIERARRLEIFAYGNNRCCDRTTGECIYSANPKHWCSEAGGLCSLSSDPC